MTKPGSRMFAGSCPALAHVQERLDRHGALEEHVLHAVGVEVAVGEHPVGGRVAVEAAEQDVALLADLPVLAGGLQRRRWMGSRKSDEVKRKSMSGLACRALVTPASAFSWFHSVGTRATTSMTSRWFLTHGSKPSRRLDGVDVAEVADQDHGLVLPAGLAGLLGHEVDGVAGDRELSATTDRLRVASRPAG